MENRNKIPYLSMLLARMDEMVRVKICRKFAYTDIAINSMSWCMREHKLEHTVPYYMQLISIH
jgi:hypothetical protein